MMSDIFEDSPYVPVACQSDSEASDILIAMHIVVTGGAGYIGSVTTAHLLEAGHDVTVVDNLSQGHEDAVPSAARFINADIMALPDVLSSVGNVDAVLHFAAFMAAGESMQKPEVYWKNNLVGSLHLLEAMRFSKIPRLIFSSTAAVYGNPQTIPITEAATTIVINTYGKAKLAVDMAITIYCLAHGMAATSLRYFNVAGAYKAYGERHPVETHLIPLALVAADKGTAFSILGDDYDTPDGTCIRDYIHVSDLARAHLLAMDALKSGKHAIYNLGNGNGFSVRQVLAVVESITGRKLATQTLPRRPGDPDRLIAASQKARTGLGWQPDKPELESMIQDAWDFYRR